MGKVEENLSAMQRFVNSWLMSRLVKLMLVMDNLRLETHNTLFVYCCHGEQIASTIMASTAVLTQSLKTKF